MPAIEQVPAQTERDKMSRSGMVVPIRAADKEAAKVREAQEIFHRLDPAIRGCAADVAKGIDKMLPFLHELEPVMSRKGKNKIPGLAGLPPWLVYLEELGKEFDLHIRSIQRRLREYRGTITTSCSGRTSPAPKPAARWTLRRQRQAAKALDVAKGAIEAIKGGKPVKPFIREWDALAYTPKEPPNVDPVGGFIDAVLTPFAVAILRYVRALEDIAYHAKGLSEDQDHRLWQFKKDFYDAPQEMKEVFFKARRLIIAAKPTGSVDGTPIEGSVQVREAAPDCSISAPSTTRTVKFVVANDTLLGHTVKLVEETTPPGKYTVKVAMVDESHLTLPPMLPQRVKQVSQ
jgi:hypothetical protein